MRHTGPLPPYVRKTNIHGYPARLMTPALVAVANKTQIRALWQNTARAALLRVLTAATFNMPPLGTAYLVPITRLTFKDPRNLNPCPRRHTVTMGFRPSDTFAAAVSGAHVPNADAWSADLDDVARSIALPFDIALPAWRIMAGNIVRALALGDSVTFFGFGTFLADRRPAHYYRNWRTGQLEVAPATTIPTLRTHPRVMDWLSAGVIPPIMDP